MTLLRRSHDANCTNRCTRTIKSGYMEIMFPLIFGSLCPHKISFVQHVTWNEVYEICVKSIFGGNTMHAPSFIVRARLRTLVAIQNQASLRPPQGCRDQ